MFSVPEVKIFEGQEFDGPTFGPTTMYNKAIILFIAVNVCACTTLTTHVQSFMSDP